MKNNRKSSEEMIKNIAVVGTVCLVVLLLIVSSTLYLKNKIVDGNMNQEEIIGDVEQAQDSESASTEMGKTVDEAKNEIEYIQEENISKEKEINNSIERQKEDTNKDNNKTKVESIKEKTQDQNNEKKEEDKNQENKQITFQAPVKGEIIREFASDSLVYSDTLKEWITHKGIDIKADKTSVVVSACDGTVEAIKTDPRYGITVIINHEQGFQTIYSNLLTAEFVVQGEKVTAGQTIGTVGNSASFEIADTYHLHFELLKDGEYQDPTSLIEF